MRQKIIAIVCLTMMLVFGWTVAATPPQQDPGPRPTVVPLIPQVLPPELRVYGYRITRPAGSGDNEYSGLAWYGDTLVLLPQYPRNFVYTIPKETFYEVSPPALEPDEMPFSLNGELDIPGFQGYEAIAFYEDTVYLTIESGSGGRMHSHLISGTVSPEGIVLDVATLIEIPQPVSIGNKADESLIMVGDQPMTLLEWNNAPNPNPVAHLYSPNDGTISEIPFPAIPYRVTDATTMDEDGRFWVINTLSPGDGERIDTGFLETLNYRGSHKNYPYIERLLELQLVDGAIVLHDEVPLYLRLEDEPRNWEGIVRLDDRGFILITDSHPGTVLAFVPYSQ